MHNRNCFLIFLLLLLTLSSCIKDSDLNDTLLNHAEDIIELYPDSALMILELIDDIAPGDLSIGQRNKKNLLNVIAKDRTFNDITTDTTIFNLADYYLREQDLFYATQAFFYSGRVFQERGDIEKAMANYLRSQGSALVLNGQDKLKGLIESFIGDLYMEELSPLDAIPHYEKALDYFISSESLKNESCSYNQLGIAYMMLDSSDTIPFNTSLFYFKKGIELADSIHDFDLQTTNRHNLGLILSNIEKDYSGAVSVIKEALLYAPHSQDSARIYCNIADIYLKTGLLDSADYYLNKTNDILAYAPDYTIYKILNHSKAGILEQKGQFHQALILYKDLMGSLDNDYENYRRKSVSEIEKKYNFELFKNEQNQSLIRLQWYFIGALILIFVLSILGLYFLVKSKRKKRALSEAWEKVETFKEMALTSNQKNKTLKATLVSHLDIVRKITLFETELKGENPNNSSKVLEKLKKIFYSGNEQQWELLFTYLDGVYDGKLTPFRNTHPLLDEIEFNICCLILGEYSNTEIATLLGLSPSTVSSKRSFIRKKLDIGEYGNILEYLKTELA